jgi:peptidoglycan/xylan/chitin deacetylase (PgdA/CDA1 family)
VTHEEPRIDGQPAVSTFSPGIKNEKDVAIAFDDWYANNLTMARSILERYDAPATL